MPPTPPDVDKRAFAPLLLSLARSCGLVVDVQRGSPDPGVLHAFERASRDVHPDEKGRRLQDQQQNEASSKGFEVGGNVASNIASKLEPEDMQNIDPQAIQEAISQIQS